MWMSAAKEHTTVMLMLFVTTPGDPITARAKMDFMEMELTALVIICDTVRLDRFAVTIRFSCKHCNFSLNRDFNRDLN